MDVFRNMIMVPSPISHEILSSLTSVDVSRLMCALRCEPGPEYERMYMNPFLDLFRDPALVKHMTKIGFSFTFLGRDLRRFVTRTTSPQSYLDVFAKDEILNIYCVVTSPPSCGPGSMVYHRLLCANFDYDSTQRKGYRMPTNATGSMDFADGWMTCLDMSMKDFPTFEVKHHLDPSWIKRETNDSKTTVLWVYNAGTGQYDPDGVSMGVFTLMQCCLNDSGKVVVPYLTIRGLDEPMSTDAIKYSSCILRTRPDESVYNEKFAGSLILESMEEHARYQKIMYGGQVVMLPNCLS